MFHMFLAAARLSLFDNFHFDGPPTEPAAIVVYVLLAGSVWLVWAGNRTSGNTGEGESRSPPESGDTDLDSDPDVEARSADAGSSEGRAGGRTTSRGKRKKRKLTREQRRRRGHINWIQ